MNPIAHLIRLRPLRRVVALGGGTGLPAVLAGLRRHLPRECRITAVVTSADGSVQSLAGTSLLRFDAQGLVVEQRDAWADADGRVELPLWAP